MHSVKVNRVQLLNIVKENQEKHAASYDEALVDYRNAVLKIAKENLKIAKTGEISKFSKIRPTPTAPVSYVSQYEKAIRMLELSVEAEIEVTEDVFNQLVLDEWHWKQNFVTTASFYKSI